MSIARITYFISIFGLLAFMGTALGQGAEPLKSQSPYFNIISSDPAIDKFPLKSTSVQVDIVGVIAAVTVRQEYKNEGGNPLEAIYIFPASTRAAVHAMKMIIGERTIEAEIREREQARQEYEEAKQAGKGASLLEEHRPNVFQMNVANILPGDVIKVELKYNELLVPTDKEYEFVYPTVVGPRYVGGQGLGDASADWANNPYLQEGEEAGSTFSLSVKMHSAVPIGKIACASHSVETVFFGAKTAQVELLSTAKNNGGNRDFILKYRLAGEQIAGGLQLYENDGDNYFLMMVQPPASVGLAEIPPREYLFVVDISGSMHGFPLDVSKALLRKLVGSLRPTDRFNVLLFAGSSSLMAENSLMATSQNVERAIRLIDGQRGGGGTELLPALQRALAMSGTEGFSRNVVIVTDGYVTVEKEAFELIRKNLGEANFFPFGIGSSVNRHLVEGMARAGGGEPFIVTTQEESVKIAEKFRKLIQTPVLTNIAVNYGSFQAYDVEPQAFPDVLALRPLIVFGKWRGEAKGKIIVTGATGNGAFVKEIDIDEANSSEANAALRYLWARHRIMMLDDFNSLGQTAEVKEEVTALGLKYNLLTAYTSFVAVDSAVRLVNGQAVTVKQPLPLPQGVSNYAVGAPMPALYGASRSPVAKNMLRQSVPRESLKGKKWQVVDVLEAEVKEDNLGGAAALQLSVLVRSDSEGDLADKQAEKITNIFRKNIGELEKCYQRALASSAGGLSILKTILELQITKEGRVDIISLDKATLIHKAFADCLQQKIESIIEADYSGGIGGNYTLTINW